MTSIARSTNVVTNGFVGRPLWSTVTPGHTACSSTLTAPSSRPESGGVTVWSNAVHTASQAGGVTTGVVSPLRNRLPGANCWHATGQAPGTATVPTPAIAAPWWGDPSVMIRRALCAPSCCWAHSRTTTPPAE
jgi:hypothetical protein